MKAHKVGAIKYRSRSAAAVALAKRTNLSNTEIAKKVGMTPQTVCAALRREMLKGYND